MACSIVIGAYEESLYPRTISSDNYHEAIQRLQSFKSSLTTRDSIASAPSSSSSFSTLSAPAPAPSPLSLQVIQFNYAHTLLVFINCLIFLVVKISSV